LPQLQPRGLVECGEEQAVADAEDLRPRSQRLEEDRFPTGCVNAEEAQAIGRVCGVEVECPTEVDYPVRVGTGAARVDVTEEGRAGFRPVRHPEFSAGLRVRCPEV